MQRVDTSEHEEVFNQLIAKHKAQLIKEEKRYQVLMSSHAALTRSFNDNLLIQQKNRTELTALRNENRRLAAQVSAAHEQLAMQTPYPNTPETKTQRPTRSRTHQHYYKYIALGLAAGIGITIAATGIGAAVLAFCLAILTTKIMVGCVLGGLTGAGLLGFAGYKGYKKYKAYQTRSTLFRVETTSTALPAPLAAPAITNQSIV